MSNDFPDLIVVSRATLGRLDAGLIQVWKQLAHGIPDDACRDAIRAICHTYTEPSGDNIAEGSTAKSITRDGVTTDYVFRENWQYWWEAENHMICTFPFGELLDEKQNAAFITMCDAMLQ